MLLLFIQAGFWSVSCRPVNSDINSCEWNGVFNLQLAKVAAGNSPIWANFHPHAILYYLCEKGHLAFNDVLFQLCIICHYLH